MDGKYMQNGNGMQKAHGEQLLGKVAISDTVDMTMCDQVFN